MGKREELKDFILDEIRIGRIKVGDQLYSRSVFMDKFDCARATVDWVISDLVGSNVLVSEKGRGTFVAESKKGATGTAIAIAAPNTTHPSMPHDIIRGFLEEVGINTEIRYFNYNELKHPRSWEQFKSQKGLVFVQPDVLQSPFLSEVKTLGLPSLALYRDPSESSFVSIDNQGGIASLVDTLSSKGCKRIAYAGLRMGRYHFPEQRYAGYLHGLIRNGLPLFPGSESLCHPGNEEQFLRTIFKGSPFPDAIITAEIPMGNIIRVTESKRMQLGRDILVACNDFVKQDTYGFPMISLCSITNEVGREGARILSKIMTNPDKRIQQYILPGLAIG
jgi:DNA-binding LacI/PurR family transcriptional regulator